MKSLVQKLYLSFLYVIIYAIAVVPLYVSPSLVFPYVTGRNIVFRILVEAAAVLWMGLAFLYKEFRLKYTWLTLSILSFTLIIGIADMLGLNPYNSFWSNLERMDGFITLLHITIYFIVLSSLLINRLQWRWYLSFFIGVSFIVNLYGVYQVTVEHVERVYSTIGNPSFLASYSILSVFIGLILAFEAESGLISICYVLHSILCVYIVFSTGTRGAMIGLSVGFLISGGYYLYRFRYVASWKFISRLAMLLFLFIAVSVMIYTFDDSGIFHRYAVLDSIENLAQDESVSSRLKIWRIAWDAIKERPLLGWGQENLPGIYTKIQLPASFSSAIFTDRTHNVVLEWLINAGFIGLISYLLIFISSLYILIKAYRRNIILKIQLFLIISAVVAYIIQNMVVFDTINSYIALFIMLAFINSLDISHCSNVANREDSLRVQDIKIILTFFSCLLIVVVIACAVNLKLYEVGRLSRKIDDGFIKQKNFTYLLNLANESLSHNTAGSADVRMKMAVISDFIFQREIFEAEGALDFIKKTSVELENLVRDYPQNLKYWMHLISLNKKISVYEPSFLHRTKVIILNFIKNFPENKWIGYLSFAETSFIEKDFDKVFKYVSMAKDIQPDSEDVQLKLAWAAILTSREDVFEQALNDLGKIRHAAVLNDHSLNKTFLSANEMLMLASAYIEINDLNHALTYYEQLIERYPGRARYHLEIARLYSKMGDQDRALKEATLAKSLNPSKFGKEAERLIDGILRRARLR